MTTTEVPLSLLRSLGSILPRSRPRRSSSLSSGPWVPSSPGDNHGGPPLSAPVPGFNPLLVTTTEAPSLCSGPWVPSSPGDNHGGPLSLLRSLGSILSWSRPRRSPSLCSGPWVPSSPGHDHGGPPLSAPVPGFHPLLVTTTEVPLSLLRSLGSILPRSRPRSSPSLCSGPWVPSSPGHDHGGPPLSAPVPGFHPLLVTTTEVPLSLLRSLGSILSWSRPRRSPSLCSGPWVPSSWSRPRRSPSLCSGPWVPSSPGHDHGGPPLSAPVPGFHPLLVTTTEVPLSLLRSLGSILPRSRPRRSPSLCSGPWVPSSPGHDHGGPPLSAPVPGFHPLLVTTTEVPLSELRSLGSILSWSRPRRSPSLCSGPWVPSSPGHDHGGPPLSAPVPGFHPLLVTTTEVPLSQLRSLGSILSWSQPRRSPSLCSGPWVPSSPGHNHGGPPL